MIIAEGRRRIFPSRSVFPAAVLICTLFASGCYTEPSPITGEQERYGYTWEQELQLGKESDVQISKQMGLYEDAEI